MKKVRRDDVPRPLEAALWGLAAGRCEFNGCNRPLWKSGLTQEPVNIAEKAHIYAFSSGGPRGNEEIDADRLNHFGNLMLVCHECHRAIDQEKDGGRYTAELLRKWKGDHERRIELACAIPLEKSSHVLLYGANIGDHTSPLRFGPAAQAIFPSRYPADDKPIELGMTNSGFQDRDEAYWSVESGNLVRQFEKRIRERLADGTIEHISVFGLAPQPLLILLGALLTDIPGADVYQLRREPPGWSWSSAEIETPFTVREPEVVSGPPALVLSLSATIAPERILGVRNDYTVWEITIDQPHNDFLQTRAQLASLRRILRPLLDLIKVRHEQEATLSIFPAVPVAAAVDLGRIRMPKADLPWRIYDQLGERGFVHALDIPTTRCL